VSVCVREMLVVSMVMYSMKVTVSLVSVCRLLFLWSHWPLGLAYILYKCVCVHMWLGKSYIIGTKCVHKYGNIRNPSP